MSDLHHNPGRSQLPLEAIKQRIPTGYTGTNARKQEVKNLWASHREMLRRVAVGQPVKEIAEEMKVSPTTVSNVKNSHLGRTHFERIQERIDEGAIKVAQEIKRLAPEAIATMRDVMNDEDSPAAVRIKAAADILDRAGYGAVKTTNVAISHGVFTPTDIDAMKRRAIEAGGLILEAASVAAD